MPPIRLKGAPVAAGVGDLVQLGTVRLRPLPALTRDQFTAVELVSLAPPHGEPAYRHHRCHCHGLSSRAFPLARAHDISAEAASE